MEKYEQRLAAAYVRGAAAKGIITLPAELLAAPIEQLDCDKISGILSAGEAAGGFSDGAAA